MKQKSDRSDYPGRILNGNYTLQLKQRVQEAIEASKRMEKGGNPAILYIAAWMKEDQNIWYEYTSAHFSRLLGCSPNETAERFCQSVMERRIYKYADKTVTSSHSFNQTIEKRLETQDKLQSKRASLRKESISQGITEAVYQIYMKEGTAVSRSEKTTCDAHPRDNEVSEEPRKLQKIWLKDIANIEWHPLDGIFLSQGFLTDVTKEMEAEDERERLLKELQEALEKVKVLSGLIPICANCKQIRDDKGYWNQIEAYISKHSDAQFSHGICPECAKRLYPEYYDKRS